MTAIFSSQPAAASACIARKSTSPPSSQAKPHPEQGFRACLGILRLEKTYGAQRLEAACQRGNDIGATSYGSVVSILKHGLDKAYAQENAPEGEPIRHANIRGRGYYH